MLEDFVFPRVKTIDWTVEVVLASSNEENIMKPLIKIWFQFEDQEAIELEMSMDKFADFRFKTAEAQKIMQDINKNPIMMA